MAIDTTCAPCTGDRRRRWTPTTASRWSSHALLPTSTATKRCAQHSRACRATYSSSISSRANTTYWWRCKAGCIRSLADGARLRRILRLLLLLLQLLIVLLVLLLLEVRLQQRLAHCSTSVCISLLILMLVLMLHLHALQMLPC